MAFVATITSRWFVARRGLVSGILTAGNATGQLIFLPVVAWLATNHGWRTAAAAGRRWPRSPSSPWCCSSSATTRPTSGSARTAPPTPTPARRRTSRSARAPAARSACCATPPARRTFWLLAGGFAICGMTTNGLIATHFVPAAHDHGMPATTAASLLARGRHLRRRRHDRVGLAHRQGRPAAAARRLLRRCAASG